MNVENGSQTSYEQQPSQIGHIASMPWMVELSVSGQTDRHLTESAIADVPQTVTIHKLNSPEFLL